MPTAHTDLNKNEKTSAIFLQFDIEHEIKIVLSFQCQGKIHKIYYHKNHRSQILKQLHPITY